MVIFSFNDVEHRSDELHSRMNERYVLYPRLCTSPSPGVDSKRPSSDDIMRISEMELSAPMIGVASVPVKL